MSEKKVRILQVISGLDIGGAHGGAERFGLELARSLDRSGYDVSVCAFWRRGTKSEAFWQETLEKEGIGVQYAIDWSGTFRIWTYAFGVRNLIRICRSEGIELLHSHFQMGTLASILAKLFSPTDHVVRTAHITLEWGERPIAWFLRKIFTDWIFPIALDKEFGVSQAIVDQLHDHPGARLTKKEPSLIYNAINPDLIRGRSEGPFPAFLRIAEQEILVGSIGRLVRQKAYEYFVSAAEEISKEFPQTRFILIGDGDDRQMLERLAESNGTIHRFIFLGQVDEVYPILKRMHVFVLPSRWEGFPTVVLESMVCGVPVVASNIPGTDELIEDQVTGWLVPVERTTELAKAVGEAISNKGKRDRIIKNAKQVADGFTFSKISPQYGESYSEIIK